MLVITFWCFQVVLRAFIPPTNVSFTASKIIGLKIVAALKLPNKNFKTSAKESNSDIINLPFAALNANKTLPISFKSGFAINEVH